MRNLKNSKNDLNQRKNDSNDSSRFSKNSQASKASSIKEEFYNKFSYAKKYTHKSNIQSPENESSNSIKKFSKINSQQQLNNQLLVSESFSKYNQNINSSNKYNHHLPRSKKEMYLDNSSSMDNDALFNKSNNNDNELINNSHSKEKLKNESIDQSINIVKKNVQQSSLIILPQTTAIFTINNDDIDEQQNFKFDKNISLCFKLKNELVKKIESISDYPSNKFYSQKTKTEAEKVIDHINNEFIMKEIGYYSLSELNKKFIDYLIKNFDGKINKSNECAIPIEMILQGNNEFLSNHLKEAESQTEHKHKKEEKEIRNKCNSNENEIIFLEEQINDLRVSCKEITKKIEENYSNVDILNSNLMKIENENSILKWELLQNKKTCFKLSKQATDDLNDYKQIISTYLEKENKLEIN